MVAVAPRGKTVRAPVCLARKDVVRSPTWPDGTPVAAHEFDRTRSEPAFIHTYDRARIVCKRANRVKQKKQICAILGRKAENVPRWLRQHSAAAESLARSRWSSRRRMHPAGDSDPSAGAQFEEGVRR